MNKNNFSDKLMIVANQNINEKKYWHEKLSENNSKSIIPYDYQNNKPIELCTYQNEIPTDISQRLIQISKGSKDGLHMILIAGLFVFLNRRYKENNILIGTPVYKVDSNSELINKILPIQGVIDESSSFKEILSSVKRIITEADEHQNYPMEILSSQLDIVNTNEFFPLFEIALMVEEIHDLKYLEDINLNLILSFDFSEQNKGIKIIYNSSTYSSDTIKHVETMFYKVLKEMIFNPGIAISEIEILSEAEKQELLYEFNDTEVAYPHNKSIPQIFKEQAQEFPEKLALEDEDKSYTYQDLDVESNKIGNYLIKRGVKKDQLVGLMAGRSTEMIIGILGILKTGGAYVPIDPSYPKERVNQLIQDSGINILLTMESIDSKYAFTGDLICIKDKEIVESSTTLSLPSITSRNIAYVMYTSGSTGTPKGVVIEQKSVLRLVQNNQFFPFHSEQKILLTGAPVFDATTFEIWGALLNGGRLYIASDDVIINAVLLGDCLRTNEITSLWLTSSLFNQLVDQDESIFDTLKFLLVGGDVLSVKHINKIKAGNKELVLINGYGPTENTTFSTTFNIDKEYEGNIPIGKPISNSTAYIFDKSNKLQAIGVYGELLVGGDGLAKEYLNNPELTREKFIENPYKPEERLYKTGDIARWLPDGNIEFLGRIDHQVKIRGFRIELGEIENVLLKHESIKETVVLAREDKGDKYLCAYIVKEDDFNQEEVRAFLSTRFPDYMIPSYFVELDKMPLTTNGKINRKILPSPEIKAGDDYVAPRNETDEKLVAIWSEVLNTPEEEISITSNFFTIGGHSLKATILLNKLFEETGFELKLSDFFSIPTIKEISDIFLLVNEEQEDDNYKEISI